MDRILKELDSGSGEKYLMPFFDFAEGTDRATVRKRLEMLKSMGIESMLGTPRSAEYMGWAFWQDMDIMVEELQRLDMTFWIQDEQTYPTGQANGWILRRYPQHRKLLVDRRYVDAVGPLPGASFPVACWMNPNNIKDLVTLICNEPDDGEYGGAAGNTVRMKSFIQNIPDNELLHVVAWRKDGSTGELLGDGVDLTENVKDGWLYWDVPEGIWSIFIIFRTYRCRRNRDYFNIMDRDSVKVLIEALYEPMYDRYHDIFGTTFRGFFSDETEFGNMPGFNLHRNESSAIGKVKDPLPWCRELEQRLDQTMDGAWKNLLPLLWEKGPEKPMSLIRFTYMDLATQLVQKNFSQQIGTWCREHGCMYIGHFVEDAGNHARLGAGAGHFFRAEYGMDMAGIDVVENQILPGHDYHVYNWGHGEYSGTEFTYALAKLGASASHIDPKKKGRTMCEAFAAYDSGHGLRDFKYVVDNLMSRGVNYIMPNFGLAPDAFGPLMEHRIFPQMTKYMTRICRLHQEGIHIAPVAVLYHGEAEWAGNYMPMHEPLKVLAQSQIDCDILPMDVFCYPERYETQVRGRKLYVNKEEYHALVIPTVEFMTSAYVRTLAALDLPIYFIDKLPEHIIDADDSELDTLSDCSVVSLDGLGYALEQWADISLSSPVPGLRYYHYRRRELDSYMFFQEDPWHEAETDIFFKDHRPCVLYDALEGKYYRAEPLKTERGTQIHLKLRPLQTLFVFFGDVDDIETVPPIEIEATVEPELFWTVAVAEGSRYPEFGPAKPLDTLKNMGAADGLQEFNGTLRYETEFLWDGKPALIDLGHADEMAEIWLNGQFIGRKFLSPYIFDLSDALVKGKNHLIVDISAPPRNQDSQNTVYTPYGLMGPVKFLYTRG